MDDLGKSLEDYLETILILQNKSGVVLSDDVARHLNYSKPSVCHAVKILRNKGCLNMYGDGSLHLTEYGREIKENVYERHRFFTERLIELGVPSELAEQDACRIEHVISEESFQALKKARWTERGGTDVD